MKKSFQFLAALTMLMFLFNACNQGGSDSGITGKWRMASIHIRQYDDQVAQLQDQVKSLSDSLATATDTASQKKFQSSLEMYQNYLSDMQARKDSSLKNTFWDFKKDGKFEGQESSDKKYEGYWEYNEKTKMMTRYLPSDSVKVDVKGDTLTLHLDSLNQILFVKTPGK
jgi:hypothetical protein